MATPIKSEGDSNAARGGATDSPDKGVGEAGYTVVSADPEAVESNSDLSITKDPDGAEQYGTSLNSYSYQPGKVSAKKGVKDS
jgi:hypothetical protein